MIDKTDSIGLELDVVELSRIILGSGHSDGQRIEAMLVVRNHLEAVGSGQSLSEERRDCLLQQLWRTIGKHFHKTDVPKSCDMFAPPLKATCFLLDHLLLCESIRNDLLTAQHFHRHLQMAFLSTDPMYGRYATHILRRLYERADGGNSDSGWSTFFVINDTLNDKDIHLILPTLQSLAQLGVLSFGWRWILLTKALQTKNYAVTLSIIEQMSNAVNETTDVAPTHCGDLLRTIFLEAINSTALFNRHCDPDRLLKQLSNFMSMTGDSDAYMPLICRINWLVVPLFHIVRIVGHRIVQPTHRDHWRQLIAGIAMQPNVHIRNRILCGLKNMYVEQLVPSTRATTDWLFDDHHMCDTYEAQTRTCDILSRFRYLDTLPCGVDDLELYLSNFETNESLRHIESQLFRYVQMLFRSDRLPEMWRQTIREHLLHNTIGWCTYTNFDLPRELLGVASDCKQSQLQLETDLLTLSPYYQTRSQALIALGLAQFVHLVRGGESIDAFVQRLFEDNVRLALLVAMSSTRQLTDFDRLLEISWRWIVNDSASSNSLASFLALLDELCRTQRITATTKSEYYQRIVDMLSTNRKWLLPVTAHMRHSTIMARILCNSSAALYEALMYGTKLVGDQIAEYQLLVRDLRVTVDSSATTQELLYRINDGAVTRGNAIRSALLDRRQLNATAQQITQRNRMLRQMCLKNVGQLYCRKPRHFANSQHHREINRLVQLIALTEFGSNSGESPNESEFAEQYGQLLLAHNHQTSVAHLLELLVAATGSPCQLIRLLGAARTPAARRSVIMSMQYAFRRLWQTRDDRLNVHEFVTALMPWTMGKDYGTRLLAQFVCELIVTEAARCAERKRMADDFRIFVRVCGDSLRLAEHQDEYKRLVGDYRFAIKPDDGGGLLSPTLVLFDVPRLTGLCSTEWIPVHWLADTNPSGVSDCALSIRSEMPDLSASNVSVVRVTPVEMANSANGNVQRKIVPLRQLFPEWEHVDVPTDGDDGGTAVTGAVRRSQLIVVASLLLKEANLGGLARTCEIFGAQELVLANLKSTETREFQALSMTAEKWLLCTEVKPFHLVPYLQTMREQGYTLIGAEQTADGRSIERFEFPAKTLLLLGNEKQGIPADLLSMLDMAVEVPQLGVVRSLNVHVSGALFVWEYAKQHSLHK